MGFEECKIFAEEGIKGNLSEAIAQCPITNGIIGGMIGAFIIIGIVIALILLIGVYIYFSLAWYTIAKKLKYKKPWLAWIPIINIGMFLQLGKFNWAWAFLIFIPFFGWVALFVLLVIATWRICEKRKYPGWFSLSLIIPDIGIIFYLVAIGFLAWGRKK
ncbi:MAG: hypothetical protein WCX73_00335 [Candidatus Pacearchaeota archaeon]|jgi:hypothetical protein